MANPNEPELETTIVYAVAADTLQACEERAERLGAALAADDFEIYRPTGNQLDCYRAMLPGHRLAPALAHAYRQFLLPANLAGGMPWAGTDVGDPGGMLLGFSLDGATARPVLLDPSHGPRIRRSGNLVLQGSLGAGKSYTLKRLTAETIDRGGTAVIIDRTARGEWVDFATGLSRRAHVVRLDAAATVSLDPLRLFTGPDRTRVAKGFLSLLTDTPPRGTQGIALGEAIARVADRGGRLVDVADELLARGRTDSDAHTVGRKLAHARDQQLAHLVVGAGTVPDLASTDCVVFHLPGLALPDRDALASDYQRAQLLDEQVYSLALVYLVAAVGKHLAFTDLARFSAVVVDEAWVLTANPQGLQLLLELCRDGRKHNAALWGSSQVVDDFPAELRHLISLLAGLPPRAAQRPGRAGRAGTRHPRLAGRPDHRAGHRPVPAARRARAHRRRAGHPRAVFHHAGVPAVPVYVASVGGKTGAIQPRLTGATRLSGSPNSWTQAEVDAVVRYHVAAWMVGDHDGNPHNILRTPSGGLLPVDLGQAFKFYGTDKLSLDFHPNPDRPVYQHAYTAHKSGGLAPGVTINPAAAHPVIKAFEAMPDSQWRALLHSTAHTGATQDLG
ncbi:MAG: ATP-binding protein, partial [Sporichthyaceae bacterium]|nr:ATP-binding protein [Sporichthyaceae bacterium]